MADRTHDLGASASPMLIGEAADRAGVATGTLRYYERLGLLGARPRSNGGYRLYDAEAVERVVFVKKAQALGLTLAEVGDVLRIARDDGPPCSHVRALLRARIDDIDRKIDALSAFRDTLTGALRRRESLDEPDRCTCAIIEAQPRPPEIDARRSHTDG